MKMKRPICEECDHFGFECRACKSGRLAAHRPVMADTMPPMQAEVAEEAARHWERECIALRVRVADLETSKNGAYAERNKLVALLASLFPSSLERHDGADWEDDWRWVVFVDLPTGQVSWHIHDSELLHFSHVLRLQGRAWDGHSNDDKWSRVARAALVSAGKP